MKLITLWCYIETILHWDNIRCILKTKKLRNQPNKLKTKYCLFEHTNNIYQMKYFSCLSMMLMDNILY